MDAPAETEPKSTTFQLSANGLDELEISFDQTQGQYSIIIFDTTAKHHIARYKTQANQLFNLLRQHIPPEEQLTDFRNNFLDLQNNMEEKFSTIHAFKKTMLELLTKYGNIEPVKKFLKNEMAQFGRILLEKIAFPILEALKKEITEKIRPLETASTTEKDTLLKTIDTEILEKKCGEFEKVFLILEEMAKTVVKLSTHTERNLSKFTTALLEVLNKYSYYQLYMPTDPTLITYLEKYKETMQLPQSYALSHLSNPIRSVLTSKFDKTARISQAALVSKEHEKRNGSNSLDENWNDMKNSKINTTVSLNDTK